MELTREQLLDYIKKQKAKIKKLESEVTTLKDAPPAAAGGGATSGDTAPNGVSLDEHAALQEKAKSLSEMVEAYAQADETSKQKEAELLEEIKQLHLQNATQELSLCGKANELQNLEASMACLKLEVGVLSLLPLPVISPPSCSLHGSAALPVFLCLWGCENSGWSSLNS